MERMKPVEAAEGQGKRWFDCPGYWCCLNHAGANEWLGWSCEDCPEGEGRCEAINETDSFRCEFYRVFISRGECLQLQAMARRDGYKDRISGEHWPLTECLTCFGGERIAMQEGTEKRIAAAGQVDAGPDDKPICQEPGCTNVANGFGNKYCLSCQGRRGAEAANKKKAAEKAKEAAGSRTGKDGTKEPSRAPETAQGPEIGRVVKVSFEGYPELYDELHDLAHANHRPVEYQVLALIHEKVHHGCRAEQ